MCALAGAASAISGVAIAAAHPADSAPRLEASGRFAEAGTVLEKSPTQAPDAAPGVTRTWPSADPLVRAGLLYELAGRPAERKRVIARLASELVEGARLSSPAEERLFIEMARDSGLLNERSLNLPLSDEVMPELAEILEDSGFANPRTERILLSSPRSTGPAWGRHVRASIADALAHAKRLTTVGPRTAAFGSLAERVRIYWDGADARTREELARAGAEARAALEQAGLPAPELGLAASTITDRVSASAAMPVAPVTDADRAGAIALLGSHPDDSSAWMTLKTYFEQRHEERLAQFCAEHLASPSASPKEQRK